MNVFASTSTTNNKFNLIQAPYKWTRKSHINHSSEKILNEGGIYISTLCGVINISARTKMLPVNLIRKFSIQKMNENE